VDIEISKRLEGRRVLIVEDQALIAMEMRRHLERAGAQVVGPVGRLEHALKALEAGGLDGAVLDIDLNGVPCWPAADALAARDIPFAFTTGYDAGLVVPERFKHVPVLAKPYDEKIVIGFFERFFA
jgi:CheY-like chemotaxis protein